MQGDDPKFAGNPAGASMMPTRLATGTLAYSGRKPSLPSMSNMSLQIGWDGSSVTGIYRVCTDGTTRWDNPFQVPVEANLSTEDNLFSAKLTGTSTTSADNSGNLTIQFNDILLTDLKGTFSWRDVNGWSSESDVCAGARIRFATLHEAWSTKAVSVQDGLSPAFINVECPTGTDAAIVFSAVPSFN